MPKPRTFQLYLLKMTFMSWSLILYIKSHLLPLFPTHFSFLVAGDLITQLKVELIENRSWCLKKPFSKYLYYHTHQESFTQSQSLELS